MLGLGLPVLLIGANGTWAFWTDQATVGGTTFTSATLLLHVDGSETPVTTTLSMSAMVPGNSSAEVLTVQNVGTAPLKYTVTGGLTGAEAASYASFSALRLTVRAGGSISGSGNSATCSGGTVVHDSALTASVSTVIVGVPRGPLAASGGSEDLCFQVALASTADSSLQGKTVGASFTVTGSSDVS